MVCHPNLIRFRFSLYLRPSSENFLAISEIFILANNFSLCLGKMVSCSYIEIHGNQNGFINHQELVSLYLVWICVFLFCCKSIKVMKAHLKFAIALAKNWLVYLSPPPRFFIQRTYEFFFGLLKLWWSSLASINLAIYLFFWVLTSTHLFLLFHTYWPWTCISWWTILSFLE